MANKRYDQFAAGTPDQAKILLQADPTTGELEKIFVQAAHGSDNYVQFKTSGNFNSDALFQFLVASGFLQVGPQPANNTHVMSQPPVPEAGVVILRLVNAALDEATESILSLSLEDNDDWVKLSCYTDGSQPIFRLVVAGQQIINANETATRIVNLLQVGPQTATSTNLISVTAAAGSHRTPLRILNNSTSNGTSSGIALSCADDNTWVRISAEAGSNGKQFKIERNEQTIMFADDSLIGLGFSSGTRGITLFPSGTLGVLIETPTISAASVILRVRARASQTADILQVTDSSNVVQLGVKPNGVQMPTRTSAQIAALTGMTVGTMIYDTTLNKMVVYTGAWETITSV